jgi:hypothetical protein
MMKMSNAAWNNATVAIDPALELNNDVSRIEPRAQREEPSDSPWHTQARKARAEDEERDVPSCPDQREC